MKEKKYIKFKKFRGTLIWDVINHKGEFLGSVSYNKHWRKWCFYPLDGTFFDVNCLDEIGKFIRKKAEE